MIAALAFVLALAGGAVADEPPELRALFPQQADVTVEPPGGLVRLDLSPAVVGACRPDLSDLRIIDHAEGEVPYLVDAGLPPRGWYETKETVDGEVVDVRREETRSETRPGYLPR